MVSRRLRLVLLVSGVTLLAAIPLAIFSLGKEAPPAEQVAQELQGTPAGLLAGLIQPTPSPCTATVAIIGDYGQAGTDAEAVATLVTGWQPDFIATVGDNNYPNGEAKTIDANIGQYYHDYIYPYTGRFGPGATSNRFFPALGNHDWHTRGAKPYLDYFTLPGTERYYDVVWGPVHLFVLDSSSPEPAGITATSKQAQWLRQGLADSAAPWQLVLLHHPPYSSGSTHGSTVALQWPYKEWGADAVIAGHDHLYERLTIDGLTYIVNGLGGNIKHYGFGQALSGSAARFNTDFGALKLTATAEKLAFSFITPANQVVDTHTLEQTDPGICGSFPSAVSE